MSTKFPIVTAAGLVIALGVSLTAGCSSHGSDPGSKPQDWAKTPPPASLQAEAQKRAAFNAAHANDGAKPATPAK